MKREIYNDLSEQTWLALRAEDVTSTEIAALFGASPYETPFELWHRKQGHIPARFATNERTILGQEIEPIIAAAFGRLHEVEVRPNRSYIRLPELGIGCSFDYEFRDPENGEWLNLETKNLDYLVFRDRWKLFDGGAEPPLHIALQTQLQMFARGQTRGAIAALVGGTSLHRIDTHAHDATVQRVLDGVARFRQSLADGDEPDPDFARDGDVLKQLYAKPDPRETLAPERREDAMDAVWRATEAAAEKKAATARETEQKNRLMRLMEGVPEARLPDGAKVLFKADKRGRRSMRLTAAPSPVEPEEAAK